MIGTSGWNYGHWSGAFYPKGLSSDEWLRYYAERLGTVEINNTFYQLPTKKAIQSWTDAVPSDFIFAVKASRYITHMKKLRDPEESLGRFLERIEAFGDALGPVLFQLPPSWHANTERLEAFLETLSNLAEGDSRSRQRSRRQGARSGPDRYAFEFRDESWFADDVLELLRAHGAALCIYHLAGRMAPRQVTADFVYVRLHGPGGKYEGSYDAETLAGWAGAFSAWTREGLDVYCYFDNDESGYAASNAVALAEMIG